MYLEFEIFPKIKRGDIMWEKCVQIAIGEIQLYGLPNGKNEWMHYNMQASGVHDSVCFMVHDDYEFDQLMIVYDALKEMDCASNMTLSHNTVVFNNMRK